MSAIQFGGYLNGEAQGDFSGHSVSLNNDGDIVAIGARQNDGNGSNSGHTRIYQYNTGTSSWDQLGSDIDGESANDYSGWSVSLDSDGSRVAIGARFNDGVGNNVGHTRVFEYNLGSQNWVQMGSDIDGESLGDNSGYSVSLNSNGDRVAIGAIYNDGVSSSDKGHVRVYDWNGTSWNKLGNDIDGETLNDRSGYSVSINSIGDIVAIGATANDGNGTDSGHTRVFEFNDDILTWVQIGSDIDGEAAGDQSGYSVSLNSSGTIIAIGAPFNKGGINDPSSDAGHVRVYEWGEGTWNQLGSNINGESIYDQSGYSVSLDTNGYRVAIGAPFNDGDIIGGINTGTVRIYDYDELSDTWSKTGNDTNGEYSGIRSGYSISLSADGTYMAIGEPYYSEISTNAGRTVVHDLAAICFHPDTNVLTNNGYINIINLKRGDLIKTNNGFKKLARLLKLRKSKKTDLVLFKKNSISENVPNKDFKITKGHPIYYENNYYNSEDFAENPKFKNVTYVKSDVTILYHLQFETHEVIYTDGLTSTSLPPYTNYRGLHLPKELYFNQDLFNENNIGKNYEPYMLHDDPLLNNQLSV
jgi:hypothetical protein